MVFVQRAIYGAVLPAFFVLGAGYNALMMLNSEDGRRMKTLLDAEITEREATLASLTEEEAQLSDRADRLLSKSLDADLLEERVRAVLGLVERTEYMVRLDEIDAVLRLAEEQAEAREAERLLQEAEPVAPVVELAALKLGAN